MKFLLCLSVLAILPVSALGQEAGKLPVLFDARERLARPDLSTVMRVRILTTVDFPPFNFADQNGRLSGFHVDLAREICAELKIEAKCQIQALPFEELEKTLEEGGGEAVMAGIAITPERRGRFAFSRPYITVPARFARNRSARIEGETAAALAGRPVGVVKDTAHELMLKAFFPKITATPFETNEAMLAALKAGKVDAVFSDGLRLPFWVVGEASENCCALFDGPYMSEKFLGEGLSVMLRGNEPDLVLAFDHALATLSRNGRLQEIYLRYFPYGLY
nr:transporter substrate-binding domain-containing protein [Rhizobium sp. LCM 4573]